jgi:hypothetical protein
VAIATGTILIHLRTTGDTPLAGHISRLAARELELHVRSVSLDRRAAAIDDQEDRLRTHAQLEELAGRLRRRAETLETRERALELRKRELLERNLQACAGTAVWADALTPFTTRTTSRSELGQRAAELGDAIAKDVAGRLQMVKVTALIEGELVERAVLVDVSALEHLQPCASAAGGGGAPPGDAPQGRGGGTAGGGSLAGRTDPPSEDCQSADPRGLRRFSVIFRGIVVPFYSARGGCPAGRAAVRAAKRAGYDLSVAALEFGDYEIRDSIGRPMRANEPITTPTIYVDLRAGSGG